MSNKNTKPASDRSTASITNVLLLLVVASIAFLGSESYRSRLEQKAQQERLYSLIENVADVTVGRTGSFVNPISDVRWKDLKPELSVDLSDKELLNAMDNLPAASRAYASKLMLTALAPIVVDRFVPFLDKEASQASRVN